MPSDDDRIAQRLADIVENIEKAWKFSGTLNLDEFIANDLIAYAVVRALEIVSEASANLPTDIKTRHPDLDWRQIKAAGNIYRHGYMGVDLTVVWDTVRIHLTPLRQAAMTELERLGRAGLLEN